jgi:hypothetical protein
MHGTYGQLFDPDTQRRMYFHNRRLYAEKWGDPIEEDD